MAAAIEALPDGAIGEHRTLVGDDEYISTEFADGHVETRCGKKGKKKGKWGK